MASKIISVLFESNAGTLATEMAGAGAAVRGFSAEAAGMGNTSARAGSQAEGALAGTASASKNLLGAVAGPIAIAAAIGAVGVVSVKMASDFEQSHARLSKALDNIGSSWSANSTRIEETDAKMRQLGFTDKDTENSLSRLVIGTKSVGTSLRDISIAADISRARNIDLVSATDMVVKANNGFYTALVRSGLVTKEQTKNFQDGAAAVDFLGQKFSGQASASADTFGGKMQVLQAEFEHVGVGIGQFLIPQIQHLADALVGVISFFQNNEIAARALEVALTGVGVALTYVALKAAVSAGVTLFKVIIADATTASAALFGTAAAEDAVGVSSAVAAGGIAAEGIAAEGSTGALIAFSAAEDAVAVSGEAAGAGLLATLGPALPFVVAGLGVVAAGIVHFRGETDDLTKSSNDLAAAVKDKNVPAMDANVQSILRGTDAAQGYGTAFKTGAASADIWSQSVATGTSQTDIWGAKVADSQNHLLGLSDKQDRARALQDAFNKSLGDGTTSALLNIAAMDRAGITTDRFRGSLSLATTASQLLQNADDATKTSLDPLTATFQKAAVAAGEDSNAMFKSLNVLDNMTAGKQKLEKAQTSYHDALFTGNQTEIAGAATKLALAQAESTYNDVLVQTHDAAAAAAFGTNAGKQALIDMTAQASGPTKLTLQGLVNNFDDLSKGANPTININTGDSLQKLAGIQRAMDDLKQGKSVDVAINDLATTGLHFTQAQIDALKQTVPPDVLLNDLASPQVHNMQDLINLLRQQNVPGIDVDTTMAKLKLADIANQIGILGIGAPPGTPTWELGAMGPGKPPGKAEGGPVFGMAEGGTFLVGEKGPEILHMGAGASGSITPNSAIGGKGSGGDLGSQWASQLMAASDQVAPGVAKGIASLVEQAVPLMAKFGSGTTGEMQKASGDLQGTWGGAMTGILGVAQAILPQLPAEAQQHFGSMLNITTGIMQLTQGNISSTMTDVGGTMTLGAATAAQSFVDQLQARIPPLTFTLGGYSENVKGYGRQFLSDIGAPVPFALGGVTDDAHIMRDGANEVRLSGESGTGGEAYIPRHGATDPLGVLGTAAGWYGAKVVPYAAGGLSLQELFWEGGTGTDWQNGRDIGRSIGGHTDHTHAGTVPGFVWQDVQDYLGSVGIIGRPTSTTRPGDGGSLHALGRAVDYGDSQNNPQQIFDALVGLAGGVAGASALLPMPSVPGVPDFGPGIPAVQASTMGGVMAMAMTQKLNAARDLIMASRAARGGAGAPTGGDVDAWIVQAEGIAGVPDAVWHAGLRGIAMRESSGNPSVVNRTDSNAQAGNPSEGLMQLTQSNFARYGSGDPFNPVDDIVAAIHYIEAKGGIGAVNTGPTGAYAKGGLFDPIVADTGAVLWPGQVAQNRGKYPETIVPNAQGGGMQMVVHFGGPVIEGSLLREAELNVIMQTHYDGAIRKLNEDVLRGLGAGVVVG